MLYKNVGRKISIVFFRTGYFRLYFLMISVTRIRNFKSYPEMIGVSSAGVNTGSN